MCTVQQRIAQVARERPQEVFTSLNHYLDVEWLKAAYERHYPAGAERRGSESDNTQKVGGRWSRSSAKKVAKCRFATFLAPEIFPRSLLPPRPPVRILSAVPSGPKPDSKTPYIDACSFSLNTTVTRTKRVHDDVPARGIAPNRCGQRKTTHGRRTSVSSCCPALPHSGHLLGTRGLSFDQ